MAFDAMMPDNNGDADGVIIHADLPDDSPVRADADAILDTLRANGHAALFVGGCVRDLLLGHIPKDYDITTNATPDQIATLFPGAIGVGKVFGVMRVPRDSGIFEIATFRSDMGYSDGRHPNAVSFVKSPRADALRRDFTINAMMFDPKNKILYDWTGGRDDLAAGIVRAIGHPGDRFDEDRLRMLRCVRFAARFHFKIDPDTRDSIRLHAAEITDIAAERIGAELLAVFDSDDLCYAAELMDDTGLMAALLPEVAAMKGVKQPAEFHKGRDVWEHTLELMRHLSGALDVLGGTRASPELAIAGLLHDIGKPDTFTSRPDRIRFPRHAYVGAKKADAVCRRLMFPNRIRDHIVSLVTHHMTFKDVRRMRKSTLRRFVSMARFPDHLALARADSLASNGDLSNYTAALEEYMEWSAWRHDHTQPLISGKDLIALGLSPGPAFQKILRDIADREVEGVLSTRDDALAFVREHYLTSPES